MDKLKFETPDMVAGNIEKIGALFPAAVTEMRGDDGQIKKGINFEVLKQLLSRDVVDGDECYEFTWVGKKAAMAEAARPITKTLRPVKEDSRDWDTTQNLYIEGDNLEVLKILQESYLGKIKMIYIDPPYNTGHDFIYPDSFAMDNDEYNQGTGYFDPDGNVNFSRENSETAGKYHSDWCNMIFSRLMLARNLLTEDGIIFISIDNNELGNMKAICNEVFGENNFVSILGVENNPKGRKNNAFVAESYEYCIIYAKNKPYIYQLLQTLSRKKFFTGMENDSDKRPVFVDKYGEFRQSKRQVSGCNKSNPLCKDSKIDRCFTVYYRKDPEEMVLLDEYDTSRDEWTLSGKGQQLLNDGFVRYCCTNITTNRPSVPLYSKNTMYKLFSDHSLFFKEDGTIYEKDRDSEQQITSFLSNKKYGLDLMTESATAKMETLFGIKGIFTNSKSLDFIKAITRLYPDTSTTVLDFFSGSATTAHAVMQLNAEDGGHRKFIMVQLQQPCDEADESFKAGYKNICEIGKERIRRAGNKIKEENPLGTKDLDIGFRVFRVDSSNMKDVYYQPEELDQQSMFDLVSNIKDDRTDLDLLYACLLDWGVEIHLPHTSTDLDGCTIHNVDNGALMACFNPNVPTSVVEFMAKQQPLRAVFRDSAFASDDAKINVTEIFKNLSPDTKVKVI